MTIKNAMLGGTDYYEGTPIDATHINATNDAIINVGGFTNPVHTPIGSIIAWLKSYTNTPSLPIGFVECNGQTLSDSDSPLDGEEIPDLNSAVDTGLKGYFLRGHIYDDPDDTVTQTSANLDHSHSVSQGAQVGASGTTGFGNHDVNTGSSGGTEMRPHNYSVVWIMRVK